MPAVCTRATWSAEGEIVAISQDAPTVWMRLPNDENSDAHQNNANTRFEKGSRVAFLQRRKEESCEE